MCLRSYPLVLWSATHDPGPLRFQTRPNMTSVFRLNHGRRSRLQRRRRRQYGRLLEGFSECSRSTIHAFAARHDVLWGKR